MRFFDETRLLGIQPNVITYSAVINSCGKCEMPDRAWHLSDQMLLQGLEPNVITYTAAIHRSVHV